MVDANAEYHLDAECWMLNAEWMTVKTRNRPI